MDRQFGFRTHLTCCTQSAHSCSSELHMEVLHSGIDGNDPREMRASLWLIYCYSIVCTFVSLKTHNMIPSIGRLLYSLLSCTLALENCGSHDVNSLSATRNSSLAQTLNLEYVYALTLWIDTDGDGPLNGQIRGNLIEFKETVCIYFVKYAEPLNDLITLRYPSQPVFPNFPVYL